MKLIKLTQNKFTQVDDEDYDYLIQYKWCAAKDKNTYYAIRTIYDKETKTTKKVKMHRDILRLTDRKIIIDHKDKDGLNNQKINLRPCTNTQNISNRSVSKSKKSSKFLGVGKSRGKWIAQIRHNKTLYNLGIFKNEIEAALAYNKKAIELHGEYASLNIVSSR